jgi:hypothetical protein
VGGKREAKPRSKLPGGLYWHQRLKVLWYSANLNESEKALLSVLTTWEHSVSGRLFVGPDTLTGRRENERDAKGNATRLHRERGVRRRFAALVKRGILRQVAKGGGRGRPSVYVIEWAVLKKSVAPDTLSNIEKSVAPVTLSAGKGDSQPPERVTPVVGKGDSTAPRSVVDPERRSGSGQEEHPHVVYPADYRATVETGRE